MLGFVCSFCFAIECPYLEKKMKLNNLQWHSDFLLLFCFLELCFTVARSLGTAITGDVPRVCVCGPWAQGTSGQTCFLASGRIWGRQEHLS